MAKCYPSSGFKTGPTHPQRAVILRYLQYKTICVFESRNVLHPCLALNTHTHTICTYIRHTYKFDALMTLFCQMTISDKSICAHQCRLSVPISAHQSSFQRHLFGTVCVCLLMVCAMSTFASGLGPGELLMAGYFPWQFRIA